MCVPLFCVCVQAARVKVQEADALAKRYWAVSGRTGQLPIELLWWTVASWWRALPCCRLTHGLPLEVPLLSHMRSPPFFFSFPSFRFLLSFLARLPQARDSAKELESQAKALAGEAASEAKSAQKAHVTVGGLLCSLLMLPLPVCLLPLRPLPLCIAER